jgi:non-heme Fe2+,alpha-ketoglutarate-dependent halogenase
MNERDLSFRRVENPSPKKLSRDQIEHFNERGYIQPLSLFDDDEIARHRAYFDNLLLKIKELKDGRNAYAINSYQALCEGIWDLCKEPRILDYVEDIVGPNIIAWASHYFCKLPHDGKTVPWHQDASYWHLTPARTVTVWLAIDDADEDNAAMKFIPGTHRVGHLKWREAQGEVVLKQEITDINRFGQPVYDCLKAGQLSLHADMLVHGSDPNVSDRRRCGLTIRYCEPEVRTTKPGWNIDSIIARGRDSTGNWKDNARPVGDTLVKEGALHGKPNSIGGN